jgi:hypothetical protein
MITPSDGVKRKTWGDLAQSGGSAGRRREAARGAEEGSRSSPPGRRARHIPNEPSDKLAAEPLEIEWDPETPVMGGRASTVGAEYLPVTKTYDELPRFEMDDDEEAIATYEPVTTEYRGPARVDEAGSEYEARTTEFRCAPGLTKFLGSGDFWSALKTECRITPAIGDSFRDGPSPPPVRRRPILSSPEPFGIGKGGGRFGEMAAELLQRRAVGSEKPSRATSRKGRLATSFHTLANHRRKIDSRIWAVGLALTLVALSWMILLVR